jgi:hypothetical protein
MSVFSALRYSDIAIRSFRCGDRRSYGSRMQANILERLPRRRGSGPEHSSFAPVVRDTLRVGDSAPADVLVDLQLTRLSLAGGPMPLPRLCGEFGEGGPQTCLGLVAEPSKRGP